MCMSVQGQINIQNVGGEYIQALKMKKRFIYDIQRNCEGFKKDKNELTFNNIQ